MAHENRIEINPKVMLGKPVIRGTRIPIELLLRKLGEVRALAEELIGESKGAELLRVSLNQFSAMRNLKHAARSRRQ